MKECLWPWPLPWQTHHHSPSAKVLDLEGFLKFCLKMSVRCISHHQFEPSHEIMTLFILHKLILQTRMSSRPVAIDVWFLAGPFVYCHTSCVRTAKALARLCCSAGLPEPLLVAYVISIIISWADSFVDHNQPKMTCWHYSAYCSVCLLLSKLCGY